VPIVVPLVALDVLVLVLWTIAAALAIALIMKEVGNVFRGVPIVGGAIAGAVGAVAQAISWSVGKLESGIDKLIGAAWHLLAHYMDTLWHQIEGQASLLTQFAQMILKLIHAHALLRALVHKAVGTAQAVLPRVKRLEREWHGIEHRVKVLERDIAKGIGHDLRIQVKALEQDVTKLENKVIPSIRSIANTAEADVSALRKWIADNALVAGSAALVGAVAWALGRLGLGGLRCNSLLNSLKNRGCGLWKGLEDLLGLFIDAVALTHLCDLPRWIEELFSPLLGELTSLISGAANSLCAQANKDWATLSVSNGPLPPQQTLYLPDNFG
jgi:hypothetical protein